LSINRNARSIDRKALSIDREALSIDRETRATAPEIRKDACGDGCVVSPPRKTASGNVPSVLSWEQMQPTRRNPATRSKWLNASLSSGGENHITAGRAADVRASY
jgi:hypothetical protein